MHRIGSEDESLADYYRVTLEATYIQLRSSYDKHSGLPILHGKYPVNVGVCL
jgi:hypothetical protein